jgi:hypothetical protein
MPTAKKNLPPLPLLSAEARLLAKADAGEGWGGGASARCAARVDRFSPTRRAFARRPPPQAGEVKKNRGVRENQNQPKKIPSVKIPS